jgi:hypothetical protein
LHCLDYRLLWQVVNQNDFVFSLRATAGRPTGIQRPASGREDRDNPAETFSRWKEKGGGSEWH